MATLKERALSALINRSKELEALASQYSKSLSSTGKPSYSLQSPTATDGENEVKSETATPGVAIEKDDVPRNLPDNQLDEASVLPKRKDEDRETLQSGEPTDVVQESSELESRATGCPVEAPKRQIAEANASERAQSNPPKAKEDVPSKEVSDSPVGELPLIPSSTQLFAKFDHAIRVLVPNSGIETGQFRKIPGDPRPESVAKAELVQVRRAINSLYLNLRSMNRELKHYIPQNEELKKELYKKEQEIIQGKKLLQSLEFSSRFQVNYLTDTEARDDIESVFGASLNTWTRKYHRVTVADFKARLNRLEPDSEVFREVLDKVSVHADDLFSSSITGSNIIQAFMGHVLSNILMEPFFGYTSDAKKDFTGTYQNMHKVSPQMASRWRAATIEATSNIRTQETIQRCVDVRVEEIMENLHFLFHKKPTVAEGYREKLTYILQKAAEVSIKWNSRKFGLKLIDLAGLLHTQKNAGGSGTVLLYTGSSNLMEGTKGEGRDTDGLEIWDVVCVVRPGFIKYGTDDGEDFEQHTIWEKASCALSLG